MIKDFCGSVFVSVFRKTLYVLFYDTYRLEGREQLKECGILFFIAETLSHCCLFVVFLRCVCGNLWFSSSCFGFVVAVFLQILRNFFVDRIIMSFKSSDIVKIIVICFWQLFYYAFFLILLTVGKCFSPLHCSR